MRTQVIVALVLSSALLPACAVKQPPAPADALATVLPPLAAVPPAWGVPASASGTVPASASVDPVVVDWLGTFSDPRLESLVAEGLQNNLDLRAAVARVDVASALIVQARSLIYPQLMITGLAGVVGRDDTRDRSGANGQIRWELDLWGRVRAEAASATASRDATAAELLFARQSLAATIATLWYSTVATERLRQTALAAATLYEDLLGLVRMKNEAGQVGTQDVLLAGADLDRARRRERAYATTGQQLVRGLEVVIGRYPRAELALATDLPAVPGAVPDGLPSELLERRPDLVAAERRVAAAFHSIQAAEAARLPRLALTASGGRSTSELLRLANVGAGFWTAGVDVLAPLFTGGALRAQVAAATADQRAALALYGMAALRAFSEVESTLASEEMLGDQQRYLESVLAQDTEALRLDRLRYDAGATDLLHVLDVQARQFDTQFELVGIRNDRLANRIALHLALGGGFATPVP